MLQVIYIAGENRSGTTLLSQVIGAHRGFVAVGELFDFWRQWQDGTSLCSCGAGCRDCEFWKDVLKEGFADEKLDTTKLISLLNSVQRPWHLPSLLRPEIRTPDFERRLSEFVSVTERLYEGIQRVSGCDVIVDTSKFGVYALALANSSQLDVRMIHMVRDSRACAFSWQRLKRKPTVGSQPSYMPRRSFWRTSVIWNARNLLLMLVAKRFAKSTTVRYEDFVRQPHTTVDQIFKGIDVERPESFIVDRDDHLLLPRQHIFAGNPDRMNGVIRIRPDDEWRSRMPAWQQHAVFTLTLPVLLKYGYVGDRVAQPEIEAEQALEKSVG